MTVHCIISEVGTCLLNSNSICDIQNTMGRFPRGMLETPKSTHMDEMESDDH